MNTFTVWLALRYWRRGQRFTRFIAWVSLLGIALGVMVLITVLSVMNGFDDVMHAHIQTLSEPVTVTHEAGVFKTPQSLIQTISNLKLVQSVYPVWEGQGLLQAPETGMHAGVLLRGVDPQDLSERETPKEKLKAHGFGVVLSSSLAWKLGVSKGDFVLLTVPRMTATPAGVMPAVRRLQVKGILDASEQTTLPMAYLHLGDARALFHAPKTSATTLHVVLKDSLKAPLVTHQLRQQLPMACRVTDWTEQYHAFFDAIGMEKTMMFLILTLIIAVAAFNLVSGLMLLVNEKRSDMAILRTCGATPQTVRRLFLTLGLSIGAMGTLLGVLLGVLLALHVGEVVHGLEMVLHRKLISASVYFVDTLPSRVLLEDIWHVSWVALLFSGLASYYPARKASKIAPVEVFREG